jgi:hypothetical protein
MQESLIGILHYISQSEASIEQILPTFSNEEAIRIADKRYRERFQAACLDEKVVHGVSTYKPKRK